MANALGSIDSTFLALIRCPITKSELQLAEPELVKRLNIQISQRQLVDGNGQTIEQEIETGLVNADRSTLHPIWGGIVVLMADQAIPLHNQD